jgi:hypothetical protein
MRQFYILLSIIAIFLIAFNGFIYFHFKDEMVFAPHVYFTELFKFISVTIVWTIILKYFEKSSKSDRIQRQIDMLILVPVSQLQKRLYDGLESQELTNNIRLILSNVNTIKLINSLSNKELSQIISFENVLLTTEFRNHINNIEFHIENNLSYSTLDSYNRILHELNNIGHVFGNKKQN